jgi:magnesium-transporting ATPase (P-type)
MGASGTEVTREADAMILADDNFARIVAAAHEGRGIFENIKEFLRYLLSSNMGEVLMVFFGVVFARAPGLTGHGEVVVLPLLATQILWINPLTDSAPALAMGVPADPMPDTAPAWASRWSPWTAKRSQPNVVVFRSCCNGSTGGCCESTGRGLSATWEPLLEEASPERHPRLIAHAMVLLRA